MADLITEWLAAWDEWSAANVNGQSVEHRNGIMDRIWALGAEIGNDPSLHPRIIDLCDPLQKPHIRLQAALVRERWDTPGADATLTSLIQRSGATFTRPMTMSGALRVNTTTTARQAALCLLNIDAGRGNTGLPFPAVT